LELGEGEKRREMRWENWTVVGAGNGAYGDDFLEIIDDFGIMIGTRNG
jgi:hypothetical protein